MEQEARKNGKGSRAKLFERSNMTMQQAPWQVAFDIYFDLGLI